MVREYLDDSYLQSFEWIWQGKRSIFANRYDMFQVLRWVRCRHCLDDRDRIFAVLGLKYHARYPWNDVVRNLEPDYSQPVDKLYERLACDTSKLGGTLRLFSAVHHGSRLPAWTEGAEPSWVPKWNEYLTSDLDHKELGSSTGQSRVQIRCFPTSIDVLQKRITVDCVRYGEVALFSESLLHADAKSKNAQSMCAFWQKALHEIHDTQCTPLEFAWTIIKISDCICGIVNYHEHTEAELHGARHLIKVLRWQNQKQNLGKAEQYATSHLCFMLEESLRAVMDHSPDLGEGIPYGTGFHSADRLKHRRLFLTQRNQVGLGPEAMRPGDVVVNLKGSTMPLIIRPQGTFYRFVGAARMPESMRRDAMAQAEQEGAKMELIEIR
jgi:hypothetical protein